MHGRLIILGLLLAVAVSPAFALQSPSVTVDVNTDTDTACEPARAKQSALPDIDEVDGATLDQLPLHLYFAPGDASIDSPVCGLISPTYTLTQDAAAAGILLNQTDIANAYIYGTSLAEISGTYGVEADNAQGAAVELTGAVEVAAEGTPATPIPTGTTQAYFLNCSSGNDSAAGNTPGSAWRTLGKVRGFTFSSGADVYVLAGTVCEDQYLEVDWSGTASNPVIIGSYYVVGGTPYSGYAGSARPEINGNYTRACHAWVASTCPVNHPKISRGSPIPASYYSGLVQFAASYVTVRDLAIHDSAGTCLASSSNAWHHLTLDNLDVDFCLAPGFNFNNQYVTVRNSRFNQVSLDRVSGLHSPPWPVALLIRGQRPAYFLFEDNVLSNTSGEGLGCLQSSRCIVRNNTFENVSGPFLYLDNNFDSVYEGNLIYGPYYKDDETGETAAKASWAFSVAVEPYGNASCSQTFNATGLVIRNNLIANLGTAFHFSVFGFSNVNNTSCDPQAQGFKVGAKIYGNTVVGVDELIDQNDAAANVDAIEIRNNVFADSEATCLISAPSKATLSHNVFDTTPSDSDCLGTNAVVGDTDMDPALLTVSAENPADPADFELGNSSVAINAGLALTATILDVNDYLQFAESTTCAISAANWVKGLAVDYDCGARSNPPDIGAKEKP